MLSNAMKLTHIAVRSEEINTYYMEDVEIE